MGDTNLKLKSLLAAAGLALSATGAGAADVDPGQWAWGPYIGAYIPDPGAIDTGMTGGLRLGYRASERVAFSGSLGYAPLEADDFDIDVDLTLLDFNAWYIFRPEAKVSLTIGAGPGWAWVDAQGPGGSSFSDDSFTANVAFGPIIKLGERANLRLLNRFRYFDERDDDEIDQEITLGLMFALGGKKAAPVVAAAPPPPAPKPAPPPPPPAKCADGDGDGVCDAQDACPQTPPGRRVDAVGCDCDFTMNLTFPFDSADLHDDDKAQLDQLAATLKNAKLDTVTATIEGHTDSMGDETYNQGLSQRRAEAVLGYLQSQGVGSRFVAKGMGESQPVADNATEAGRAQNRRVVVHRTDCSAN